MSTGMSEFASQGSKQAVQGMFAGAVSGPAEKGCHSGNTFIDDNHSPVLDNTVYSRLGAVQGTKKIDGHDFLKHLYFCSGKEAALGNAGIVDKHIDAAEAIYYLGHGRFAHLSARHITHNPHGPTSTLCKLFFTRFKDRLIHINEADNGTVPGKFSGQGQSNATGPTGDHDDFFLKRLL
jgi:hypothetical protein